MTDYLVVAKDRARAIRDNTNQRFKFEHQEVGDVEEFKHGIFENRRNINPLGIPVYYVFQDNDGAGVFVKDNSKIITEAADEFGVDPNFVRAVIYTEISRGYYDRYNLPGSDTVLPGNVHKSWELLITGSDVNNKADNIRLTAKLLSEIGKRLDEPYPEDIYSLYNSMAHDRTYENKEIKNTPYFLKQVLKARAWEFDTWKLPNRLEVADIDPADYDFPAGTVVDEREGTIRHDDQPGSAGVRLDRSKIFARRSDAQVDPDGFLPGKGDLFVPKPAGQPDQFDLEHDHGNLPDGVPEDEPVQTASFAADDDDLYRMAEGVFSSLTLDDWAIIRNDNDPFDNRDPFSNGVKWVPGLAPPAATP